MSTKDFAYQLSTDDQFEKERMTRAIDECTDVERLQEIAKMHLNHKFQLCAALDKVTAALDEVTDFAREAVTHAGEAIAAAVAAHKAKQPQAFVVKLFKLSKRNWFV